MLIRAWLVVVKEMRPSRWFLIPIVAITLASCSSNSPGPLADSRLVGTWSCESGGDEPGSLKLSDDHKFELDGFSAAMLAKIYPNYSGATGGVVAGAGTWYQNESQNSGQYLEVRFFFEDSVMGDIGNVPVFVGSKSDDGLYLLFTDPDFSERIECGTV